MTRYELYVFILNLVSLVSGSGAYISLHTALFSLMFIPKYKKYGILFPFSRENDQDPMREKKQIVSSE